MGELTHHMYYKFILFDFLLMNTIVIDMIVVLVVVVVVVVVMIVGPQGVRKNSGSHIDASHSRQPLVKGERLVRYEVNAVMLTRCWKHE